MPQKLDPPSGHAPGAVLSRDAVPASKGTVGVLVFFAVCAGVAAAQVAARAADLADPVVIAGTLAVAALFGLIAFRAVRGIHGQFAGARQPDALAVDSHGVAARCGGRAPFRYAWSQVRRLDAGAGREQGWLRLWLVEGVPGPAGIPDSRRTTEGALLVLRFGAGAERVAVGEAVRRYAPPGVRIRL